MQYDKLLNEEKRKVLNLMKQEYALLDYSNLQLLLDNNINEPRWLDTYIMIYKAELPACVCVYDILLEKLSTPSLKFYYKNENGERYIAYANERMIKQYVWYLITNQKIAYQTKVQYIPNKEYIKEILKYKKFKKCGLYLRNTEKDEFVLDPIGESFKNIEEAKLKYERIFDAYDLFKNLKLEKENLVQNFETCVNLGKDKRMIATLSTMLNYFDCKFMVKENYITIDGTKVQVDDEITAGSFQEHLLDTYQFFRNVVNTENKIDIVSEVYNRKVAPHILKQFADNMTKYLNIVENKDLIDWIITISKESKYTLDIKFDDQGVFYIDGEIIVTPLEAREFYISYMDKRKDHLSMTVYSNSIFTKIKKVWNLFRARFVKR